MKKRILTAAGALVLTLTATAQQMDQSSTHSPYIKAVDEYMPAPGQFVNVLPECTADDTPATVAAKCTEAIAENHGGMVALGAYGGFITFHFDHSIANIEGQRDIYIKGNAYSGNSEPGIVMVSKDVNHNGIADDPWYEIAGSADTDNASQMTYQYEITYQPNPLGDISWTDNQGNSGAVKRNAYHEQEYFPLWHDSELTFKGTLLPRNAENKGSNGTEYWVMSAFRYGYADNAANSDTTACSIDISWAVDEDRQPAALDFVDFVRIYNGENQECGWIGETSTEVCGAEDLHLEASLKAITASIRQIVDTSDEKVTGRYTLDGRRVSGRQRGLHIIRTSHGRVVKIHN